MADFTEADADTIRARIVATAGIRETHFGDQGGQFSTDDALKALSVVEAKVAADSGKSRTRFAAFDKGC